MARTYSVTPPLNSGITVTWPDVGQVSLTSLCQVGWDETTGSWGVGTKPMRMTNNGPSPVVVFFADAPDPSGYSHQLAPHESYSWGGGLIVGTDTGSSSTGAGHVTDIAVFAADGASATGQLGVSGSWDPITHTGQCTFTLHLHG